MYAPAPAAGAPRNGMTAGGPILAICCLLFILFLIASTVVLALIPVYLATAGTASSKRSTTMGAVLTAEDNETFSDGTLDSATMSSIGSGLDSATSSTSGAFKVTDAMVAADPTGKRKRRGFGTVIERRTTRTTIIINFYIDYAISQLFAGKDFTRLFSNFQIYATINTLRTRGNGGRVRFRCRPRRGGFVISSLTTSTSTVGVTNSG